MGWCPPVFGLVALAGSTRLTNVQLTVLPCVLARSRLSTTPPRLWPAAPFRCTVQGRRNLPSRKCTSGKASTKASFNRHGHPLRPREGARGVYVVQEACEDAHNDIPFFRLKKRPSETLTPSPEGEGLVLKLVLKHSSKNCCERPISRKMRKGRDRNASQDAGAKGPRQHRTIVRVFWNNIGLKQGY